MPKLQIDGQTIAEIDQATADRLLIAAKPGIGMVREPSVKAGVSVAVPGRVTPSIGIELIMDFLLPV